MSHPEFDPGASSWLYFDKWLIARDAAEQSRKAGLNLAAQLSKVEAELVLAQRAHNSAARGRKQAEAELAECKRRRKRDRAAQMHYLHKCRKCNAELPWTDGTDAEYWCQNCGYEQPTTWTEVRWVVEDWAARAEEGGGE
jgi:hypothetical protein